MTTVVLFLALGLLLLAGEVFFPSMVLAVLGLISIAVGTVAAFISFGAVVGGTTALGALVLVALTLWLEFSVFPKTRLARNLSMGGPSGRNQGPVADRTVVIGRDCVARTVMAPSGFVELDGHQYDALCRNGHAASGDLLRIVNVDSFQLIVIKPTNNS